MNDTTNIMTDTPHRNGREQRVLVSKDLLGSSLRDLGFKMPDNFYDTKKPSKPTIAKFPAKYFTNRGRIGEQAKGYQPPRKNSKLVKVPKDKFSRRRHNLRAKGLCTRCGKPCAPYADCDYHREYKRLCGILGKSPIILQGVLDEQGLARIKTDMIKTAQTRSRLHISHNEGSIPSPATNTPTNLEPNAPGEPSGVNQQKTKE